MGRIRKILNRVETAIVNVFWFSLLMLVTSATLIWLKDLIVKSYYVDGVFIATSYYLLAIMLSLVILLKEREIEEIKVFKD